MPGERRDGLVSPSEQAGDLRAGMPRNRFPSALRLSESTAFDRAFRAQGREQGRYFIVHRAPNTLSFGRLGMVVARRTARSSVGRNRLKRLIREVFRNRQRELSGWDWVVRVKSAPTMEARREARKELESLLVHPL